MTKFFVSLLLVIPMLLQAKEPNHVWLPYVGGSIDPICRTLFADYDNYFNSNSLIIPKQGVQGELAVKEMLESSQPNKMICANSGLVLYNKYNLPDIKTNSDNIEMIVQVVSFPTIWYVNNNTPSVKNLGELVSYLKSLKRPVNVGVYGGHFRTLIEHLAVQYGIDFNFITFKNGAQQFPSLVDGSIDLIFDVGAGLQLAQSGRFKVIGYHADYQFSSLDHRYVDFSSQDQNLPKIKTWMGIAVPKNADPEFKERMGRRLAFIIQQKKFRQFVEALPAVPSGMNGNELDKSVAEQAKFIKKNWK